MLKLPPRLPLARIPTPIQKLKKLSEALGKEIYIWRDDLTGFMDSGNKIRKLEFLLADALAQGCDWIVTCGGPQSNHTRATASAARQLGLGITILTSAREDYDFSKPATGNLMLNQILTSEITWIDPVEFQKNESSYTVFLRQAAEKLKVQGKKPYVIPLGGSNALGCMGYLNAVGEMLQTWKNVAASPAPQSIFCALGSAGTFMGIRFGLKENRLSQTQLHGINILGPVEKAQKFILNLQNEVFHRFGVDLDLKQGQDGAHIVDGYSGAGYAIASDDDLAFYTRFAREEGVMLDPCYTGKAFQGMISEIKKTPERFGNQVLFLHSGGAFANFAYADQFKRVLEKQAR